MDDVQFLKLLFWCPCMRPGLMYCNVAFTWPLSRSVCRPIVHPGRLSSWGQRWVKIVRKGASIWPGSYASTSWRRLQMLLRGWGSCTFQEGAKVIVGNWIPIIPMWYSEVLIFKYFLSCLLNGITHVLRWFFVFQLSLLKVDAELSLREQLSVVEGLRHEERKILGYSFEVLRTIQS